MAAHSVDNARPTGSAAPIYSMEQYPSGPIDTFPPPLPLLPTRRSLRSRRGVAMQVQIPRNPLQSPTTSPWSAKGHVQPHRNHLPRRRNTKRFVITHEPETPDDLKAAPEVAGSATPISPGDLVLIPIDEACYVPNLPLNDPAVQEIVDRLYVAFGNGTEAIDELPKLDGADELYTHVISISYGDGKGSVKESYDRRTQRLHLVLPAEAREERPRVGLGLTDAHLRAARDFIAQALPASVVTGQDTTSARVLVTAPFGRQTDAMCVAMCSLSLTTGKNVEELLDAVEDETMLSVWKGEISGDEVERIQKIAKAWSWTQAVQPVMN